MFFIIIISAVHVSDGFSAHHHELIKLCSLRYCHAFLLSTAGVVGTVDNPTTPAVDSRKA